MTTTLESGASPSKHHKIQLDSLRGIAVFLVMWSHWMPMSYQGGVPCGHFGVQLFFVLSGYLITDILLRHRREQASNRSLIEVFYLRRALRLFPPFFLMLIVLWFIDFGDTRQTFLWHALYLTNVWIFVNNSFVTSLVHAWSLSVEEQFYLAWPWAVLWLSRVNAAGLAVACLIAAPVFRVVMPIALPQYEETVLTASVCDAFASGALIAFTSGWPRFQRGYRAICCYVATPLFICLQTIVIFRPISISMESLRQTTMVLCFAQIVLFASNGVGASERGQGT